MGAEFLQKTGKPIQVARDRDRLDLATGDLFTRCLSLPRRYELLRISEGKSLLPGDDVTIEFFEDKVVAVVGDAVVGEIQSPTRELRALIEDYGIVGARVEDVDDGARVADIEIFE